MSDSVVADFVARTFDTTTEQDEPVQGRVVMNESAVVFATADHRVTIPLDRIFDVTVGRVPRDVAEFFQDTVSIGYRRNDAKQVAVVESDADTVDRFKTVLFKALLNGTAGLLHHPARVGGRVTGTDAVPARVFVEPRTVSFRTESDALSLALSSVVDFERLVREHQGTKRQVVSVRHIEGTQQVTSEFSLDDERELNLLGRYLRLEYSELKEDLAELDLSTEEVEVLVSIYAADGDAAAVVGGAASTASMVLKDLREKDLVADADDGTTLTTKGRIAVNQHVGGVNG
ncbi:MAG: CheF family chemotaxis protein [Haloplanus sp.]